MAIRIGVASFPPALFAGLRFGLAGLIFFAVLRMRGYSLPTRGELLDIAVVGVLLLVFANGVVVWSEQWVPSSIAALIVATLPFWIVGIEALIPHGDRLTVRKTIGILVGFAGLVILLGPDFSKALDSAYLRGLLAIIWAPVAWAAGSIYSKYRTIRSNPFMAASLQLIIAGGVLVVVGFFAGEFSRLRFAPESIAALVYLAIFGSIVGYVSYIYALAKLPASKVSMYAYVNPVIAVILGWLVLDERLDWQVLTATAVVLIGVVLVKTARSRESKILESDTAQTPSQKEPDFMGRA